MPTNVIPFRARNPDDPPPAKKDGGISAGVALLVVGGIIAFAYARAKSAEEKAAERAREIEDEIAVLDRNEAAMQRQLYDRPYRPWF